MEGMVPLLLLNSLAGVADRNEPVPLASLLLWPPNPMLMLASVALAESLARLRTAPPAFLSFAAALPVPGTPPDEAGRRMCASPAVLPAYSHALVMPSCWILLHWDCAMRSRAGSASTGQAIDISPMAKMEQHTREAYRGYQKMLASCISTASVQFLSV